MYSKYREQDLETCPSVESFRFYRGFSFTKCHFHTGLFIFFCQYFSTSGF